MNTPPLAIESDTQAYLQEFARQAPRTQQSLDDLRESYRSNLIAASVPADPTVSTRSLMLDGDTGPIVGRLYSPHENDAAGPLLLYVHGGGFAVGDLASHDALMRLIAASADIKVMALEYRRAPEHPFPAARDDVIAAYRWAARRSEELGIDPSRIALGGESAGAAHAASATLRLTGPERPAALWLMSPALDATLSGNSYTTFSAGAGRTADEFAYLWSLYVPDPALRATADASPGLADPCGMPPLFIYTAEFDPARDDGESFAARAQQAGVDVVLRRRDGLIHQYPEITGVSAASRLAVVDAARELATHLKRAS